MRSLSGKVESPAVITDAVEMSGMYLADVVVAAGGVLHLSGMCCRQLTVERGGKAEVHGMVRGDVVNHGELRVFGMVAGRILSHASTLVVDGEARVAGGVERV